MKVFVIGGTGAIGRILLPELSRSGHDVVALVRSRGKALDLESRGIEAVVGNPLDPDELTTAVVGAAPEAIVHELTALDGVTSFKHLDDDFELTNRFRTVVTDTLLAAARRSGARRFIVQSFCGWPYAREGGPVKSESDALDRNPPAAFRKTLAAIRYQEEAVKSAHDLEAFALRYGVLYGPGTSIARGGEIVETVRRRRLPIVGGGTGVWSFTHIRDAAGATLRALTEGTPGIYNVVDDEPAPVSSWLPVLAQAVGGKPPRTAPVWLARLAIGEGGVSMMTRIRGGSNARAKREIGWQPIYPSWRQGFTAGL